MTFHNQIHFEPEFSESPKSDRMEQLDFVLMAQKDTSDMSPLQKNYTYDSLQRFQFPSSSRRSSTCSRTSSLTPSLWDEEHQFSHTRPSSTSSVSSTKATFSPRYTPSPSFQMQYQTLSFSPSRTSRHKRSSAISITSSPVCSLLSEVSDDSTATSPSTIDGIPSDDDCKADDISKKQTQTHNLYSIPQRAEGSCRFQLFGKHPQYHHQCHTDCLPLPLVDLEVAGVEPNACLLNPITSTCESICPDTSIFLEKFSAKQDAIFEEVEEEDGPKSCAKKTSAGQEKSDDKFDFFNFMNDMSGSS